MECGRALPNIDERGNIEDVNCIGRMERNSSLRIEYLFNDYIQVTLDTVV